MVRGLDEMALAWAEGWLDGPAEADVNGAIDDDDAPGDCEDGWHAPPSAIVPTTTSVSTGLTASRPPGVSASRSTASHVTRSIKVIRGRLLSAR
jgi:hypothetical protein